MTRLSAVFHRTTTECSAGGEKKGVIDGSSSVWGKLMVSPANNFSNECVISSSKCDGVLELI